MKLLFIHKYDYHEPLGIMMLSSFIKKRGHTCELLDVRFEKNYLNKIKEIQPDIIAFSLLTANCEFYYKINLEIKRVYNFFSVFGGPHTTFFPEFIQKEGVDAICIGEGEEALAELADKLSRNEDISKIENLFVKQLGQIHKNGLRTLIENLDELPFADRELINKYSHYKKRSRIRTMTMRGCPYNCSYCFNHSFKELFKNKGNYIRRRSVDHVVEELLALKKMYNPKNFEFHDDVFVLHRDWLKEFLEKYKKLITVPFDINVRLELVDENMVQMLKNSGCKCVHFGIESGNFNIRKELLKRNVTDEQIISSALLFKKYKIPTKPFNIVGLPGETIENVFETIKLNSKARVTYAINTIYHPYPQTELARYAIEHNYFDGNLMNIDKSLFYGKSAILSKDIKKIIRLHYLFPFCVRMPFLITPAKLLIKIPFDSLYRAMFFLYRAYSVVFIYKQLSIREMFIVEGRKKQ